MSSFERVDAILARVLSTYKFATYMKEKDFILGDTYAQQVAKARKKSKETSAQSWIDALDLVTAAYGHDVPDGVDHNAYLRALAEQELVRIGVCPPHWKKPYDCDRCGYVAVASDYPGTGDGCPWCGVIAARKES